VCFVRRSDISARLTKHLAADSTVVHSKNRSTDAQRIFLTKFSFIVLKGQVLMTFYQHNRCIFSGDQRCYHIVVVRVISDCVAP
jgi:hypothetical protein